MLPAGVQAATRPRAGLSPPDRFRVTTGSDANLLSPDQRTAGMTKGGSLCFLIVTFPFVPTSIN